ncbi:14106_t:CDS:2 [Funneliformis caledonium]|uniref:14106_t:CDS:1 n=1 Tax=Funneliformis caledonium TaxID=1117310 RepID=A0A9N9AKB8_9GLOM|nr:14106_t:CDS:2 [Funneliformis caledonium]
MSLIYIPLSSAMLMKKQSHCFEMKNGKRYFLQTAKKCQKSVIELIKRYLLTDLSSFRKIIFESFLPTNTSYSNKKHFDLDYVNLVYCAIYTLWGDDDDFILDPLRINLIRGEGMSMASSDRKNDISCDVDQKMIGKKRDGTSSSDSCGVDRKKIGRKGDGIFRLKSDRDMLVVLITKCKGNEQIARQLQIVGILHIVGRINDPPLAFVIKDVLRAKAIIMRTLRPNRCTTSLPMTLPLTFKTPNTIRSKDGESN